ncbi:single-stranded DNA-binding protein [Rhodanobacter denitrificans]|uniref:single-stranded DNA-binding protein n=1 Tax=Rhodanobacter denitrificans TaxID=666685 RepID=UPI00091AF0A4|nr:single-stranded DNA-binding protein [Rhodanobacter denitrificans]UJJ52949.1 single-stranded DNA-binding protein [Rhodanobacter denitrificans]
MDINTHTIQGRLAAVPRVLRNERGAIARLRVVTNYRYQDRDNNWQQRDTGHNVIVRGDLVSLVESLRVGDGIFVIGFAEDHEYTDASGVQRVERQLVAKTVGRPLAAAPSSKRPATPQEATPPTTPSRRVAPSAAPAKEAVRQPPAVSTEGDCFDEMDEIIKRGAQ